MHVTQFISSLAGLALTSQVFFQACEARSPITKGARMSPRGLEKRMNITNFLISDISSISTLESDKVTYNNSLSFLFTDTNSNTNTSCSHAWSDTLNSTANMPSEPIECLASANASSESFQWQLKSYPGPSAFQARFLHGFNDPKDYAPPWSYINYASTTNVSLACHKSATTTLCRLPRNQTTLVAPINEIWD